MDENTVAPVTPPNKGGAPFGNQNARKHGFYSANLNDTEREALEMAAEMRGIDNEIALLRVKIQSLVRSNHGNVRLTIEATSALARLIKIKDKLSGTKDDQFALGLMNIYRDMIVPMYGEEGAARLIMQEIEKSGQKLPESTDAPSLPRSKD